MEDFRNLKVWAKAHELTLQIYSETRTFPKDEMYGITSQVRRAAISIEANIAEGCGRRSDRELRRFLQIARGSASELECHLLVAKDLRMLGADCFVELESNVFEVQRMLCSLADRVGLSTPKLGAKG
jgi:four helix bundle protein